MALRYPFKTIFLIETNTGRLLERSNISVVG